MTQHSNSPTEERTTAGAPLEEAGETYMELQRVGLTVYRETVTAIARAIDHARQMPAGTMRDERLELLRKLRLSVNEHWQQDHWRRLVSIAAAPELSLSADGMAAARQLHAMVAPPAGVPLDDALAALNTFVLRYSWDTGLPGDAWDALRELDRVLPGVAEGIRDARAHLDETDPARWTFARDGEADLVTALARLDDAADAVAPLAHAVHAAMVAIAPMAYQPKPAQP